MASTTIQKEIEDAVPKLLEMARELSWSKISDNCKFILTEIRDSQENFLVQRKLLKKKNDRKIPVLLGELMPSIQSLYYNFYDINLYIYKANKNFTVIDIRYYPKSSLEPEFARKVLNASPMLHCKVPNPPWLFGRKKKFDINWEHKQWLINWKLFLGETRVK